MTQPDLSVAPQLAAPIYDEIIGILRKHNLSYECFGNIMNTHAKVQLERIKEAVNDLIVTRICDDF